MSEEKDLLQGLRNGDTKAFRELFTVYYRPLIAFARSIVMDHEASKDIIQEVFVRIWENRKNLDIHTSLRAFLFTCVRNSSIDYIRQQKRFSGLEKELLEMLSGTGYENNSQPEALNSIIYNETCDLIDSAIDILPEQCRKVFIMSRYHGLKHKQIAEKLNVSPKTVEAHIYAALKFIREKIKKSLSD